MKSYNPHLCWLREQPYESPGNWSIFQNMPHIPIGSQLISLKHQRSWNWEWPPVTKFVSLEMVKMLTSSWLKHLWICLFQNNSPFPVVHNLTFLIKFSLRGILSSLKNWLLWVCDTNEVQRTACAQPAQPGTEGRPQGHFPLTNGRHSKGNDRMG